MTGKILTANSLETGDVIYFAKAGDWSADLNDAFVGLDESAWTWLGRKAEEVEKSGEVVGAYLVEVETYETGLRPTHIRERIRTIGPSVRRDLGKQSEGVGIGRGPIEALETC